VTAIRIVLGVVGGLLLLYGTIRLVHGLPTRMLVVVVLWLAAAVLIHHGVLSPLVLGVGATLRRYVPDRGRGFVQAGLIMAATVTVIAIPLIMRQLTQPPAKAMLLQDYRITLLVLLVLIAVGTSIAYAIRVAKDRARSGEPTG
jgi:hypothetical protein